MPCASPAPSRSSDALRARRCRRCVRCLDAITSLDPRWSRLTIVMKGSFGELQRAVVAHELTHVLMAATLARQPLWFKEGVAAYAETVGWDGSRVALGRVPRWRQWSALRPPASALRDLLRADGRLDPEQYSLAWGLVHYLMHRRAEAFGALQERFAAGEEPLAAWRATFPEWDPGAAGGAERLLDEVWSYLLAASATEREQTERALRRAVEADRSSAAARIGLASYLLQAGNAREASPHATEAVRLAPWSAPSLDTLAAVEHALGRCEEALELQRRAVENVPESDRTRPVLERYRDRLASLERSCGAPTAAAE